MDESDLLNFKLNRIKRTSKLKKPGEWIDPDTIIEIDGKEIIGGFFYTGNFLKGLDAFSNEPSLIDPDLTVNFNNPNISGSGMGYWPTYSLISPESRAAYLNWLRGSRDNTEDYIGFVFLYLYGLERRLLLDNRKNKLEPQELQDIYTELYRLKDIYNINHSFEIHINSLLSYLMAIQADIVDLEDIPNDLILSKNKFNNGFKYLMGYSVRNSIPITSELAYAWVYNHPEYNLRTPAVRCDTEFKKLFSKRFSEEFPSGMIIKENKKKLVLHYIPVNVTLRNYIPPNIDLPDPCRLKKHFSMVQEIADLVIKELEPLSRYMAGDGHSKKDLNYVALIPVDLLDGIKNTGLENIRSELTQLSKSDTETIDVELIMSLLDINPHQKLDKKIAQFIIKILGAVGYGVAPDLRYHHTTFKLTEQIVLFKTSRFINFEPSHEFNLTGAIIRLADLIPNISEQLLINHINGNSSLTDMEKLSLRAYLKWRLLHQKDSVGLKLLLSLLNLNQKEVIGNILIDLSIIDGKVDSIKTDALKKVFNVLDLEDNLVKEKIDLKRKDSFALDHDLLKIHEEETKDVQEILENIFAIDEIIIENKPQVPRTQLDKNHLNLYNKLIKQEEWEYSEVEKICSSLNLMVSGAIEVINDWAYDLVDAPLIEDENPLYIDDEIKQEIECILKN
ncbi:MAG: TerB N-terminal domain-containing protein [Spirochaetaceae bacterium]